MATIRLPYRVEILPSRFPSVPPHHLFLFIESHPVRRAAVLPLPGGGWGVGRRFRPSRTFTQSTPRTGIRPPPPWRGSGGGLSFPPPAHSPQFIPRKGNPCSPSLEGVGGWVAVPPARLPHNRHAPIPYRNPMGRAFWKNRPLYRSLPFLSFTAVHQPLVTDHSPLPFMNPT